MDPVDLCVIDDDTAVLDSLSTLLRSHGFAQQTFSSAEAFIEALDSGTKPSCIVSDVKMAGMSGLELQKELNRRAIEVPLILMTGHGQVSMAVKALKAGAFDFIEKPFDEQALVDAIRQAIDMGSRRSELQRTRAAISQRMEELSARQRQVMDLVVRGYSSKEIAVELGISPRTVETYRLWIMEKMGAKNLADLVRMAMQLEGSEA